MPAFACCRMYPPLQHNTEVKLFIGTTETVATLRFLGVDELEPGEEGWIQLEVARSRGGRARRSLHPAAALACRDSRRRHDRRPAAEGPPQSVSMKKCSNRLHRLPRLSCRSPARSRAGLECRTAERAGGPFAGWMLSRPSRPWQSCWRMDNWCCSKMRMRLA